MSVGPVWPSSAKSAHYTHTRLLAGHPEVTVNGDLLSFDHDPASLRLPPVPFTFPASALPPTARRQLVPGRSQQERGRSMRWRPPLHQSAPKAPTTPRTAKREAQGPWVGLPAPGGKALGGIRTGARPAISSTSGLHGSGWCHQATKALSESHSDSRVAPLANVSFPLPTRRS